MKALIHSLIMLAFNGEPNYSMHHSWSQVTPRYLTHSHNDSAPIFFLPIPPFILFTITKFTMNFDDLVEELNDLDVDVTVRFPWEGPMISRKQSCLTAALSSGSAFNYQPSCTQDGDYTPKQCFLRRCWCSTVSGYPFKKLAPATSKKKNNQSKSRKNIQSTTASNKNDQSEATSKNIGQSTENYKYWLVHDWSDFSNYDLDLQTDWLFKGMQALYLNCDNLRKEFDKDYDEFLTVLASMKEQNGGNDLEKFITDNMLTPSKEGIWGFKWRTGGDEDVGVDNIYEGADGGDDGDDETGDQIKNGARGKNMGYDNNNNNNNDNNNINNNINNDKNKDNNNDNNNNYKDNKENTIARRNFKGMRRKRVVKREASAFVKKYNSLTN
ncbi:hypothetical protein HELRODRAFT_163159 [Helobdella robusta]|uniref:Thyroglobulin type-1 domain-containing protein n=1 Tax=Helobdella robusta TaxID=6412 RepID=T1ETR0_HELRO|nr:hypothetical protein HELRODRAFT_163159 [Helobdella robusta]ESN96129.1 hypothetical protein HELRODRAFT_163159 [Helobdella robusta]